jgi:hypothetical protein
VNNQSPRASSRWAAAIPIAARLCKKVDSSIAAFGVQMKYPAPPRNHALLGNLNAFGDNIDTDILRQPNHGLYNRCGAEIREHLANERTIDLDAIR